MRRVLLTVGHSKGRRQESLKADRGLKDKASEGWVPEYPGPPSPRSLVDEVERCGADQRAAAAARSKSKGAKPFLLGYPGVTPILPCWQLRIYSPLLPVVRIVNVDVFAIVH